MESQPLTQVYDLQRSDKSSAQRVHKAYLRESIAKLHAAQEWRLPSQSVFIFVGSMVLAGVLVFAAHLCVSVGR